MKAKHNLVLSLMKAGKYPEAESEYARLIQAKPDKREFYLGVDLYTEMKRYDKLVEVCTDILKIDPKDATAHLRKVDAQFQLASIAYENKDKVHAKEYFGEAEKYCLEALKELDPKSKEYAEINVYLSKTRHNLKMLGQ